MKNLLEGEIHVPYDGNNPSRKSSLHKTRNSSHSGLNKKKSSTKALSTRQWKI
jgi:hypothetical protein